MALAVALGLALFENSPGRNLFGSATIARRLDSSLENLGDSSAESVERQVRDRVQIKLTHDVGAMGFSCFYAEVQSHGYFLACFPFGQKLQHLPLAGREGTFGRGFFLPVRVQISVNDHFRDLAGKEGLMVLHGFYSGYEIAPRIRFQQKTAGSHRQHFAHRLLRIVHSKDQDVGRGAILEYLPGRFDAV